MTMIEKFLQKADEYDEQSAAFYDESDYEQGNYFQGLAHGLREAARLIEAPEYLDHPLLT